jgi:uncharacterized FlaG/YvyC family protein
MEVNPLSRIGPIMAIDLTPRPQQPADISKAVVSAVRALNKSEFLGNRELSFSRDTKTRATVIKIVERTTGEVLEQIPPEEVLQMMARLSQQIEGETNQ